jgi:signal peptidase
MNPKAPSVPVRRLDPSDRAFVEVVSEVLGRGHSVRFRAKGTSMTPTIREGEVITVVPVQPNGIRRGEIILYRSERGVFGHRVVRVTRGRAGSVVLLPRGDACQTCDEPVEESAVLGRIVAVERDGESLDLAGWCARTYATARAPVSRLLRSFRSLLRGG